jgi:glycosyltransferase involved in cell wall biosynthesis
VSPLEDAACLARLIQELRRLRAEHARLGHAERSFLVHTHSSKAGVVGRLAAHRAGVPKIVHTIHGFGFHEGQHPLKYHVFLNAERAAARVTDAFVGVSRANLAEARAKGIIKPHHRTELIRSGMDLSQYKHLDSRRTAARAALQLSQKDEAIVCIGNFKPQKDPLTMIEAMRILAKDRPNAILLLAGDGGLRPEVERAIARAELGPRVRLLGWRRDIPDLLAAADVVALSSIFEGLPRSAVQAVAARRTFVGTRVDGTSEIIHDGKNGYLVEPRDPAALAKALALALVVRPIDPADEQRIVEWDAERMVRQLGDLYSQLAVG